MSAVSSYELDFQQEQIIGKFLDDYYARNYPSRSFERITARDLQYKGVDLFISSRSGTKVSIDEKSMLHYINQKKDTFCFELSYLKGNTQRYGWLFDNNKLTEYYFLITSIFLKDNISPLNLNNKIRLRDHHEIKSCLLTMVNRRILIENLSECLITNPSDYFMLRDMKGKQITEDVCNILSNRARENSRGNKFRSFFPVNQDMTLCLSGQLNERAVNLLINLDYLKKLNKCGQTEIQYE